MSTLVQAESLSKLRKGYKPVLVRRKDSTCIYGCMGRFRTDFDLQQHMIYAHEAEGDETTLRVINEAVRNIGRTTPLDRDSYSIAGPTKREGDWKFVPRGVQSVHHPNNDKRSTKTGNSAWKTGLSRVLSFNKKSGDREPSAARSSVRTKNISNPIPHQSSLEAAERIGTDLAIPRPRYPNAANGGNYYGNSRSVGTTNSNAYSSGSSGIGRGPLQDNPIALEDKDFDSASDSDNDVSPPSSPFPISTPQDVRASLTAEDFEKKFSSIPPSSYPSLQTYNLPQAPRHPAVTVVVGQAGQAGQAPRSPPGSFSRPTPAAYPLLLRTYLDKQSVTHSTTSLRSPTSPTSPSTGGGAPTRPPRPPIPTRNPARPPLLRGSASSEDGHSCPSSYNPIPNTAWLRRSPSHGALRI